MDHSAPVLDTDNFDQFYYPSDNDEAIAPTGILVHTALPTKIYPSFAALRTSLQDQAAAFGFAIVTKRSDAAKGVGTLGCTIGGIQ